MGNIIVSQLNLDAGQPLTGAIVLCALLSACATYAFFENEFKKIIIETTSSQVYAH